MSETTSVPFSHLRANDEINARATTKEGIDEMAASIARRGLIQPLAVRPADDGKYEIIDGGRRFKAIAKLVKDKTWKRDALVPVLIRNEDDADALESSLAANTVRLPMHPVDQHTVFSRLADQGRTVDEIATSFGLATRTVRQHMALGKLAPEIRDAWKKGTINTETAQAFTEHADHSVQAELYGRLKKEGSYGLSEYRVRRELMPDRAKVDCREMKLVGIDAYLAAGGTLTESLFVDESYVDDAALLQKLFRERLAAECERLRTEGWAWADFSYDLYSHGDQDSWRNWPELDEDRTEDDDAEFTAEERAQSGVVVMVVYTGEFSYYRGILRSDGTAADDDAQVDLEDAISTASAVAPVTDGEKEGSVGEASSPQISNALAESISETLTVAVAETLAKDPFLALRVAVAGLTARAGNGPVRLHSSGWPGQRYQGAATFNEVLKELVNADTATLMARFAQLVAGSLDCRFFNAQQGPVDGVEGLRDALLPATYLAAAREQFNAPDYFKRANKAVALAALEEMEEAGAIRSLSADLSDAKKVDLSELASTSARACGWLPPELRHQVYELILPDVSTQRLAGKDAAGEQGSEVAA